MPVLRRRRGAPAIAELSVHEDNLQFWVGVAGILYCDWLVSLIFREEYSSRADGFLERILKSVNTFVKYHNGPQHVIREAKDYFALLEAFKKEFKVVTCSYCWNYCLFRL